MFTRNFSASAFHGPQNLAKASLELNGVQCASQAANALAEKISPGAQVFPGRLEHPVDGRSTWSFGWTGSGLRIWVTETP